MKDSMRNVSCEPSGEKEPEISKIRTDVLLGWLGVFGSGIVSSFFALFLGAESVADKALQIGHLIQVVLSVALGIWGIRSPKLGSVVFAILGAVSIFYYGAPTGYVLGLPLLMAAGGFYYGRIESPSIAYAIVVGLPVLAGTIVAIATARMPA